MVSQYLTVLGVHSINPQLKSNPHQKNKKVKYILRAGIGLSYFMVICLYSIVLFEIL